MIAVSDADIQRLWGTLLFPIAATGKEPGETLVAQHYPEMMGKIQSFKRKKAFQSGKLWLYQHPKSWMSMLVFPVRPTPKSEIDLGYIEAGFENLTQTWEERGIEMLQIQRIGTTRQWREIVGMAFYYLSEYTVILSDPATTYNIGMPDTWRKIE